MKVLFDQGVAVPLRGILRGVEVDTAAELGWSRLENGDLIGEAEAGGYECMVTTDQNLKYQQHLGGRRIGIVVLLSTSWPRIQKRGGEIEKAIRASVGGGYVEVEIP